MSSKQTPSWSYQKVRLAGFFLSISIFVPIAIQWKESILSTDVYWRYQGRLLSQQIVKTGHIPIEYDQGESFLLIWVNNFVDEFSAPLIVSVISQITGLPIPKLMFAPFFTLTFILIQGELARKFINQRVAYLIGILFAVSFKFVNVNLISNAHRVTLGFTLFFVLVLYLINIRKRRGLLYSFGTISLVIILFLSYRTLAIATLSFWFLLYGFGHLFDRELIKLWDVLLILIIGLATYTIVYSWVIEIFQKLFISTKIIGATGFPNFVNSIVGTPATSSVLKEYLYVGEVPNTFHVLFWIARVIVILLFAIAAVFRLRSFVRNGIDSTTAFDALLMAIAVQGVIFTIFLPFFAPSAGMSPRLLALYWIPTVGAFTVIRINSNSDLILRIFLIALVVSAPAFLVTTLRPTMPANNIFSTDESELHLYSWVDEYSNEAVTSDFNTISKYYTVADDPQTSYIPPPGQPAYSDRQHAERLVNHYYQNPSQAGTHAKIYIVSKNMILDGMFHLGSITTISNHRLNRQLSSSKMWLSVYTNGEDSVFHTN